MEECTSGVRCTGRDPSNSHKPITTHAPRRTLRTSRPKRITPRRTKKPDERAKTFREAEQAPVSANANNKRNRQLSRDILLATSFHKESTGNSFARQSQPNGNLTEGHAFRKATCTITRGTWHACQGRGLPCLPWLWHDMLLANAEACHAAGQGHGKAC